LFARACFRLPLPKSHLRGFQRIGEMPQLLRIIVGHADGNVAAVMGESAAADPA